MVSTRMGGVDMQTLTAIIKLILFTLRAVGMIKHFSRAVALSRTLLPQQVTQ